ncbi:hypothetical protein ISS42_03030 [Candidatus Shapirobacteria bacterium]|nr:hypothetical protein [Candidatus Shapirobacteria bacterium]
MDSTIQLVFIASLSLLTLIFVIIGIWVVLVLKEIRGVIRNLNQTVDNIEKFSAKLSEPAEFLGGMIKGLERGLETISLVKGFFGKSKKNEA